MDDKPKTKRRWFRFSLRTLLVLVTVACVPFAWLGHNVWKAQRERAAVAAIQKLGGEAAYDYQRRNTRWHTVDPSAAPPGSPWLRKLLGETFFANVSDVYVYGKSFCDADLVHLQSFTKLVYLRIGFRRGNELLDTQIGDAGLVHIQGLSELRYLIFDGTQITDAGLVHLEGLIQLEHLTLHGTQVTNAGLLSLRRLKHLKTLSFYDMDLTDAGILHLRELVELERLKLADTQVTDAGCQELQKALPDLVIERFH